uniref:RNA-directed DNA polymerase n=1 Tax=Trichuris muris TaxID=70415 RepID=A0A5S6QJF2_TRIMR
MTHISHIEEFDISNPAGWEEYAERVEFYLAANAIRDATRKLAVLCSVCGPKTYSVIKSLTSPEPPASKTFDEVMKLLGEHFVPKPSEIYRRFQFQRRFQKPSEGIAPYVAELRRLAQHCNFGVTLESRLRDQLVCGLRDENLQRQLLCISDLTFNKALDRALAAEAAITEVATMHSSEQMASQEVQVVRRCNRPQERHRFREASQAAPRKTPCYRCGGPHSQQTCRFKDAVCNFCKRVGHIERVCRVKAKSMTAKQKHVPSVKQTNTTNMVNKNADSSCVNVTYAQSNFVSCTPLDTTIYINGIPVKMEVDSGAAFTLISEVTYEQLSSASNVKLIPFAPTLRDFQGQSVSIMGSSYVTVEYGAFNGTLQVVVVKGNRCNLLGRNWFDPLNIHISGVYQLTNLCLDKLIEEYAELFSERIGTVNGPSVKLHTDDTVAPIQMSARRVPFALKQRIEEELNRLVAQGVLEPVQHTTWATPIVPVLKPNGDIRICGDYKCTVNKALRKDLYKIPSVNDVLSTLKKGKLFAKLDLAQAYQQLVVDDASAELQTIITHKGAFKPKRLQYGIASAPGIFQRFMETLLANLDDVLPYFDDVLIVARSQAELASTLKTVFQRLLQAGIRLKRNKCAFGLQSVKFLGYRIDSKGIHPAEEKVAAIQNFPLPRNKQELQSFLGLLNFYHNFLPNKADIAEPLYRLLDKHSKWSWNQAHSKSFSELKQLISSDLVLTQYDDSLPLILTCDASPLGVGCVLAHLTPDGMERPIAFHSRTLSPTERKYAQIDREALAIVVGIKKFHHYIYGRHVEIRTDHKPLLGLLARATQTSMGMSPRMTRWSILLSAYDYDLVYKPGKEIGNADALSRLPQQTEVLGGMQLSEVLMLESMPKPPISARVIAKETSRDPILHCVLNWIQKKWPRGKVREGFRPFALLQNELSIHKDCVLRGTRVIIPTSLRRQVLQLLHASHPGIVRMKSLARSYVWWPHIDKDIESFVQTCLPCQESRNNPPVDSTARWPEVQEPWSRVHIDFFGPFQGKVFFILVDAYSKWVEVRVVPTVSSKAAISALRSLFATHGLPDCVISDNGSAFTSTEFAEFMKSNCIRHMTTAPFHPASNGQAERSV